MLRVALLGAALTGCSIFNPPPDSYTETGISDDGPDTTDTTPDTTDDDSGSGSGGDSGGGSSSDFDCDQNVAPDPAPGDCVAREVACGETFVDTTKGGTSVMDSEEYSSWYCLVFPDGDYSGSERIYYFTHPGTGNVEVTLDTPCADLDLFVFQWEYWSTDLTCPTSGHSISSCDAVDDSGGGSLIVYDNSESHYIIIVDGPEPVEDIFELDITCP